MNRIILMGNICNDLELKENGDMKILHFNIAVQRRFKNKDGEYESDFFRVSSFGKTAEFINKFFSKGSKILVEGRLQNNNYTDAEGKMQYTNAIIVENVEFVGAKKTVETDSVVNVSTVDALTGDDLPF